MEPSRKQALQIHLARESEVCKAMLGSVQQVVWTYCKNSIYHTSCTQLMARSYA
jgi:hypothetical protein